MSTFESVIANVKETNQHLATVEASLFEVVKLPLIVANHPELPDYYKAPEETYSIYKTTGGSSLGVMGATFEAMQPKEFFNIEQVILVERIKANVTEH